MKMILLTKGFAESNKHKQNGLNLFGYGKTITDKYFCDVNSLVTHPELFNINTIKYIEVALEDVYMEEVLDDNITNRTSIQTIENKNIVKVSLWKRIVIWIKKLIKRI